MRYRTANTEDIPSCHRLFFLGKQDHPNAYQGMTVDYLQNIIVAETDDGNVIGMISAIPTSNEKTMLMCLVVDREFRGKGIATGLIQHAQEKHGKVMAITVPHVLKSFHDAGMKTTGYLVEN